MVSSTPRPHFTPRGKDPIPVACKTYHTITVYTTVFLKMNRRVRNTQKTSRNKYLNINLGNVHFVGLYCTSAGMYSLGRDVSVTLSLFMRSTTTMKKIITTKIKQKNSILYVHKFMIRTQRQHNLCYSV